MPIGGVETYFLVENGIVVALQRLPISHSLVPRFALRSIFTTFDVGEGHLVGCHHAAACPHLDGEVTQSQTALHRQAAYGLARIFHEITSGTAGCHLRHHIEGQIFGRHPLAQPTIDGNTHRFGPCLEDALRSHYHLHLAGTDTESYGAHRSVGRGVRVAANNGHTRQRQSSFRTYNVNDAVLGIHHAEVCQAKILGILCQRIYLCTRNRVFNRLVLIMRRRVMIGHAKYLLRTETTKAAGTQTFESLRTGYLVAIEAVNVKLCRAILHLLYHVGIPYFIKECIHIYQWMLLKS